MCGIFGFVRGTPATAGYREFMYNSLVVGQLRGMDGAGLAVVDAEFVPESLAKATLGMNLAHSKDGGALLDKVLGSTAAFGHHRYKTHGEHKDEHCHPFVFNHITGVHNGTVPTYVLSGIDKAVSHDVDSGRIYAALSKTKDPIDVLKNITGGAYALVWYDGETHTVHMARNTERPLHIIEGPSGVVFASEAGMLEWLSGRSSLHISGNSISLLNPLTLYSFPLEDVSKVTAQKYDIAYSYVNDYPSYYGNCSAAEYWNRYNNDIVVDEGDCAMYWTMEKLIDENPTETNTAAELNNAMYTDLTVSSDRVADIVLFAARDRVTVRGQHVMYGVLMKPGSLVPIYSAPVIVKAYLDTISKTLPERHHKNTQYPVVKAALDRVALTIEGHVVPIFRQPELRPKDNRMVGFEPEEFKAAEMVCKLVSDGALVINRSFKMGYN